MIIGLTRVRNESEIIKDTLDHMATFCDAVVVYDDCSTDDTLKICREHPIVVHTIQGLRWDSDRKRAEWQNRAHLLKCGKAVAGPKDWFVYMDADERIEFDWKQLYHADKDTIGFKMKLFDFYITNDDISKNYNERKWMGPEYRNILMAFRNLPTLDYSSPDQREVHLRSKGKIIDSGYVKHYGKAVSVKQWEETCEYYSRYFPKYSAKWEKRKGKAIHTVSSFGLPLITWDEKEEKGIPLTKRIELNSIY